MASIIIAGFPAQGHVAPLLTLARNFVERGDDVRFITGSGFAEKVRATGARFIALPAEADFGEQPLSERFPERARLKGVRAVAFDVEHVFARPAKTEYESLTATLADQPADIVFADPAFVGAALLLGLPRPARPAVVMCCVIPLCIESRDIAPFGLGLPPARYLNRARNTVLAGVHHRILKGANGIINDLHREVHGTDMPGRYPNWGRRADALIHFTVPSFEYPMTDAPPTLRFAGPLSATGSQAPLPPWWSDLGEARRVVHVTQGTVANTDYDQAIGPTMRALADEDVLVVVATGGRPVDTLPPLPANARAAEYLPYDELFPRTAVFVTNGGYGGVQYALRYGVPIVATGGKEDKPEVGARVQWAGVGRRIRSDRPSPRALRREILRVLDEPRYRHTSRRIAAEMAASPGFAEVAAVLEDLVPRRISESGQISPPVAPTA
ncbi:glycosyl transferase [Mycobacterium sp. GA-1285]|uniref:glycosyltransferase n=1 Tax=Mycobacterium sp. GA-1285 TaxID=1772282 RepID=UPI00074A911B|nr:nucleotide disphospho-sugar-binding domain-containing protein [Mycobacterium sp. GA-1285]KUI23423.1 glycosyl transferase [Mycobacterium sp. GA-1285]